MLTRLRDEEGGWALVAVIAASAIVLVLGGALLSLADTQSSASSRTRANDAAYNLAEGVLNAEAFLLSRAWPEVGGATPARNGAIPCGASPQTLRGTTAPVASVTTPAARIQNIVSAAYVPAAAADTSPAQGGGDDDDEAGPSWLVQVCDDTAGSQSWDDAILSGAAYDANGQQSATGPRRMWVRATATVGGRTRTLVSLVQVNQVPALPLGYGVLAGGISTDVGFALNGVTSSQLVGSLISPLLETNALVSDGAKIGIRCGLLNLVVGQVCLGGVFSALNQTALSGLTSLLTGNGFVQYAADAAVAPETINAFRRQAQAGGTYVASVAAGGACLPAGTTAASLVFVEQVGSGDSSCVLDTSSNPAAKALVVANGRVIVRGSGTFTGVLYAANQQRAGLGDDPREVVRLEGPARVRGAVFADGTGATVGIYPRFDVYALIDALPLCQLPIINLTCGLTKLTLRALGVGDLVNWLLGHFPVTSVLGELVAQVQGYTAVAYDEAVVARVTSYGSSGTVAGTFRQVPAR